MEEIKVVGWVEGKGWRRGVRGAWLQQCYSKAPTMLGRRQLGGVGGEGKTREGVCGVGGGEECKVGERGG